MKYLYIDCFSGFEPMMLLGALADIGSGKEALQKSFLPGVCLSVQSVKRMGMEAVLATADSKYPPSPIGKKETMELSEYICTTDSHRELLKKYISIRSSAASPDEESAVFDKKEESVNLSALASVFDAAKNLGIEKIYVSTIFASKLSGLFDSYTKEDTLCISKKYGLKTRPAKEECEIFTPSGAALLASLGAEHKEGFIPPGIIKIGYGAGKSELENLPNILRLVMGEESEGDALVSEKAFFESFFDAFSVAGMKER